MDSSLNIFCIFGFIVSMSKGLFKKISKLLSEELISNKLSKLSMLRNAIFLSKSARPLSNIEVIK